MRKGNKIPNDLGHGYLDDALLVDQHIYVREVMGFE